MTQRSKTKLFWPFTHKDMVPEKSKQGHHQRNLVEVGDMALKSDVLTAKTDK